MATKNLIFEQKGNYGIVRINRPNKKNALHFDLLHQLKEMFTTLRSKRDLNIIILTGYKDENSSFFSSGIDLYDLKKLNAKSHTKDDLINNITELQNAVNSIEDVGKIVIAMVTGYCFGSALEIALACDFIISSSETKFGLLETKYGIIPDLGGTFRLLRRVGYQFTKQIIMLADTFSAQEARRMGLINWVTGLDEIAEFAENIVKQISENKFEAVISAKKLIDLIHPIDRSESSKLEMDAQIKLIH